MDEQGLPYHSDLGPLIEQTEGTKVQSRTSARKSLVAAGRLVLMVLERHREASAGDQQMAAGADDNDK